jgi:hypothetical protein
MDNFDLRKYLTENKLTSNNKKVKEQKVMKKQVTEMSKENIFMDVQDFNNKEYPHIHSWDESIDWNDMLSFAQGYAKYVATLAAQEFTDTDIPKEAIDKFLSKFNI